MKKIDDYMHLPYRLEIVEDLEEGGFVASYPDLKGCISSAETEQLAIINAKEAKKLWLEAAIEGDYPIPQPSSNETYSGQFKLRMPKSLHRKLAENSKYEGISMNQYCLYLLAKNMQG